MYKAFQFLLVLLVVLILVIVIYSPADTQSPLSIIGTNKPIIFAHRGSRVLNPENTLLAFQNALDFGADVVETDVQLTKDRQLVIFHDDTVDRVTNGSGRVSNYTLAEMQQLDAGYRFTHDNGTTFPFRGTGIRLTTPEEVFDTFPKAYFNIEIKNPDPLAAELLYKVIVAKSMQRRVIVGGRWCPCIRHFRSISAGDHIPTSACEGEVIVFLGHAFFRTAAMWYSLVRQLPAHSLQVPAASGPFRLDTTFVFSALKMLGKHVHYWVINEPNEMKRLLDLGADGIITDRPDIAVRLYETLGLKNKTKRDIYNFENKRFYVPVDTHIEVHTCVGIICFVLQNLYVSGPVLALLVALFLWRKCGNKKQKQA